MNNFVRIRGARTHNLKNISLDLPRDTLIVFTGVSGSGKSSLAFDTIYAEGQRRYVQSLSVYARQFLEISQKPDVDHIDGLSPAISIEQKTTSNNPRSTVGTITEIYDYMRLLWAKVGIPFSPETGLPICSQTVSEMVDKILDLANNAKTQEMRILLLAPVVRDAKGTFKKEINGWQKGGFVRLKVDGQFYNIEDCPLLKKNIKHTIDVVVDRLIMPKIREDENKKEEGDENKDRLAQSLEVALALADGIVVIEDVSSTKRHIFSEKFSCPMSGFTIEKIEPRLFSFNSPHGACPECNGIGTRFHFDESLIVASDTSLSLRTGIIIPWGMQAPKPYYWSLLQSVATHYNFSPTTPWQKLSQEHRDIILYGSKDKKIVFRYETIDGKAHQRVEKKPFEGVIPNLQRRFKNTISNISRDDLFKYQSANSCDACHGTRLKKEALCVKIDNRTIHDIVLLSIDQALDWFEYLFTGHLTEAHRKISTPIIREIVQRLGFLKDVGLGYLSLIRGSGTLSGGEAQRIRLASQIGAGLMGVLYVLDEPSIGLHQKDNDRLLKTLMRLRDIGNTVIMVEHDQDAILAADYVVDIGPGAGIHGGAIVAQGTLENILKSENSVTGAYLSGKRKIAKSWTQSERRTSKHYLEIDGARGHNLKNINIKIPLGVFVCFTGVSGSGKSTLLIETIDKALRQSLLRARQHPEPFNSIHGVEYIDKIIDINQSPIGRTPRSNPATYTGIFTHIREWFANLPLSKSRGYKEGRFSFNVKGGRCEACEGDGIKKIAMHFLSDVFVECDVCRGKRYNRETLEIKYNGHSIADILDMTVDEAFVLFKNIPSIVQKFQILQRVGLGYIKNGQSATTLSGGEAQRIKLSKELSKKSTGNTVYILDEPTTGLHFHDIDQLLNVLHELVDHGNSVFVIEHNLDIIKTADWIVDLGPDGGDKGGSVVVAGTPETVMQCLESYTGKYLTLHKEKEIKKEFF